MTQQTNISGDLEEEDLKTGGSEKEGLKSPININSNETIQQATKQSLEFYYTESRDSVLINTGYFLKLKFPAVAELTGGPLLANSSCRLREIIFHWGQEEALGSEHTVNGTSFPMEIQFLHWNSKRYHCYEEALGKPDGITVVAVFVKLGRTCTELQMIIQNLWQVQFKAQTFVLSAAFNPDNLLPPPTLRQDFWNYRGSLTCHPYSDGVQWIIMRYPITISNTQMDEFRRLLNYKNGEQTNGGSIFIESVRPTQPLRGRIIWSSFEPA